MRRDILVPEGLLVEGSCLVHPAMPLVYLAHADWTGFVPVRKEALIGLDS
jgi:hypothetical protein